MLPERAALHLQGVTDGWPSARDWVDAQGGIKLEALTKQYGNAKIWATECTRHSHSLHLLLPGWGLHVNHIMAIQTIRSRVEVAARESAVIRFTTCRVGP